MMCRLCVLSLFVVLLWSERAASGAVETVLHSFSGAMNVYVPFTGQDGNVYGRTGSGGANDLGVFYRLSTTGDYTELYQFVAPDGSGNLIQGADGNFYGIDHTGGASQNGSVYRLTAAGERTTVFDFGDGSKGERPESILQTGDGDFYGVFQADAAAVTSSPGDVYHLTAGGVLTTVYRAADYGTSYANTLTLGGDGNLYGLPTVFAAGDSGALVKIVPGGSASVLYHFSPIGGATPNVDGAYPNGVVVGADGVLYGTTAGGANGAGTFFRVTPDGTFSVVRAFDVPDEDEGTYSYLNYAISFQGADGNFYGVANTVSEGVAALYYTSLFQINPDGTVTAPIGPAYEQILELQPLTDGSFYYLNYSNDSQNRGSKIIHLVLSGKPQFFNGEEALGNGVYSLSFDPGSNATGFGEYAYLADPHYLFHFDLGFEYVFDAPPDGVYLYDFASNTFFYTSVSFAFPYLYDFSLNTVLYYYPDPNNAGHYTSSPRYFYDFATGQVITK